MQKLRSDDDLTRPRRGNGRRRSALDSAVHLAGQYRSILLVSGCVHVCVRWQDCRRWLVGTVCILFNDKHYDTMCNWCHTSMKLNNIQTDIYLVLLKLTFLMNGGTPSWVWSNEKKRSWSCIASLRPFAVGFMLWAVSHCCTNVEFRDIFYCAWVGRRGEGV